jgi:hypothetical protein
MELGRLAEHAPQPATRILRAKYFSSLRAVFIAKSYLFAHNNDYIKSIYETNSII